jgi:hypothetical protein
VTGDDWSTSRFGHAALRYLVLNNFKVNILFATSKPILRTGISLPRLGCYAESDAIAVTQNDDHIATLQTAFLGFSTELVDNRRFLATRKQAPNKHHWSSYSGRSK